MGGRTSTSGQGRRKGSVNKSTATARLALAAFVDNNAERLQGWLEKIADGIPAVDEKGKPVVSKTGAVVYEVAPDPGKAFDMFTRVVEYHIPKLARQEITGPDGGPVEAEVRVNVNFIKSRPVDA